MAYHVTSPDPKGKGAERAIKVHPCDKSVIGCSTVDHYGILNLRIHQTCVNLDEGMRSAKDANESSTRINALEKHNIVFA